MNGVVNLTKNKLGVLCVSVELYKVLDNSSFVIVHLDRRLISVIGSICKIYTRRVVTINVLGGTGISDLAQKKERYLKNEKL